LDDYLSPLTSILDEAGVGEELKESILRIGYILRDRIIKYIRDIPLISRVLREASLHLAGRGKFIRGLYTYFFSKGLDIDEESSLILATSTELYHLASLIHDDIIDKAPYRRGLESVHNKFGIDTAIIAGDLLIVYSNYLLSDLGCEVIKIFASAGVKLADGESMELETPPKNLDEYYRLIRLKTSSVFEAMFESAVVLSERYDIRIDAREMGRYLGYAFQMSDDLLDRIGDPNLMGKLTGMDRRENNIIEILMKEGRSFEEAIEITRRLIRENIDVAVKYLDRIDIKPSYKSILLTLIYLLEGRNL